MRIEFTPRLLQASVFMLKKAKTTKFEIRASSGRLFEEEQGWRGGESARLPSMWPGFSRFQK